MKAYVRAFTSTKMVKSYLFHPESRNATFALARLDYKKMISKSETVVLIQAKRRVPWI